MKITESLNPAAEAWRPTPQPPPLLSFPIIQTPPPPPPPLQRLSYYYFYHPHYPHCLHPIYTISFPAANQFMLKAADAATPLCKEKEIITEQENGAGGEEKEKETVSPSWERNPAKKGFKKGLPPRLRRAFRAKKLPPAIPKKEWKQKNTTTTSLKSSGERGVAASLPPSPPAKTTLMIRNIPSQLRRNFMLKFLDHYCRIHSLEYDFFYLPIDFRRLGNLGYAFVNLTSAVAARKLMNILNKNHKWGTFQPEEGVTIISNKICEIDWATTQGKEALVRKFERSIFRCDDSEFLPVLLVPPRNGWEANPPPPVPLGRMR